MVVFKNKQTEKDHKREMWKNVSNKKVSLVIASFTYEDHCAHAKKQPITKETFLFEIFFHISIIL